MKFKESSKKIMSMFLVGIMIFTTILNIPMGISHGDNLEEQISVEEKTDIKKDGEEIQLEKENIEEIEEI